MMRRIFNFVYWTLIAGSVLPLSAQDSVVAGPAPQSPQEQAVWISISPDVCSDEVVAPAEHLTATACMPDSSSVESEAEAYFYVNNKIANTRDLYEVPLDVGQFVAQISPQYRQKLYDKHSRVASIIPALVNFFPIPFLGTLILKDNFGGYILIGATVLAYAGVMGKVSRCTECQTSADIMLYTALGLGLWVAVRPFYLYEKNNEYNKTLAAVLNPPSISFLSINPALRYSMAGVVVPAMQVTIGF